MIHVVFFDFDYNSVLKQIPPPSCQYFGHNKETALAQFGTRFRGLLNLNTNTSGRLYFMTFDSEVELIQGIKQSIKAAKIKAGSSTDEDDRVDMNYVTAADLIELKTSQNLAICVNVLKYGTYKEHKQTSAGTAVSCAICADKAAPLYKNAYGKFLCADCWDNIYMPALISKVEWVLKIASRECAYSSFTNEELTVIAVLWNTFKGLLPKTTEEIAFLEEAVLASSPSADANLFDEEGYSLSALKPTFDGKELKDLTWQELLQLHT